MRDFLSELNFQIPQVPEGTPVTQQQLTQTLTFVLRTLAEQLGTVSYPQELLALMQPNALYRNTNLNTVVCLAADNMIAGDIIMLAGVAGIQPGAALATPAGIPCGFCLADCPAGQYTTVCLGAGLINLTSLIPGSRYYISSSPGIVSITPPTSGYTASLGLALTSTTLLFNSPF